MKFLENLQMCLVLILVIRSTCFCVDYVKGLKVYGECIYIILQRDVEADIHLHSYTELETFQNYLF